MKKLYVILLVVLASLIAASTAIAQPTNFVAHLSGSGEVPSVATTATGQAVLHLNASGTELDFMLMVANIDDVTQAHIHCGAADVAGPVVVFLYGLGPVVSPNGVLAQGTRGAGNVIPRPSSAACPGGVANFAELIAKMQSGDAYVNVHTVVNPGGEIRGQIQLAP